MTKDMVYVGLAFLALAMILVAVGPAQEVAAQGSVTAEASAIIVVPPHTSTPDNNTGQSGLTPTPEGTVGILSTPDPPGNGNDDDTVIKVIIQGCPGVEGAGATVTFTKDGASTTADISAGTYTTLDVPFGGEWDAFINGEFVGTVSGDGQAGIILADTVLCPTPIPTPQFVPDTGIKYRFPPALTPIAIVAFIGLLLFGGLVKLLRGTDVDDIN